MLARCRATFRFLNANVHANEGIGYHAVFPRDDPVFDDLLFNLCYDYDLHENSFQYRDADGDRYVFFKDGRGMVFVLFTGRDFAFPTGHGVVDNDVRHTLRRGLLPVLAGGDNEVSVVDVPLANVVAVSTYQVQGARIRDQVYDEAGGNYRRVYFKIAGHLCFGKDPVWLRIAVSDSFPRVGYLFRVYGLQG